MTEEQFWKCTPKKLHSLFKVHKAVNGLSEESTYDTIDNILF